MKKFSRNCPDCNTKINYSRKADYKKAVENNTCCRKCKNKPKIKQCEQCGCDIVYKTYSKKLCNKCKKQKRLEEAGKRQCPQCNIIITYNTKYDRIIAENNNSVCSKCVGQINKELKQGKNHYDLLVFKGIDKETAKLKYEDMERRRLETRSGYKHSQQTIDKIQEARKDWEGHTEETKEKMSDLAYQRYSENPELREKIKKTRLKNIRENPELEKQRAENCAKTRAAKEARGEYTGGMCTTFVVERLRCQGNYERMYIENLVKSKKDLPTKSKPIKTPFGYYTPDFEYNSYFVEIKSNYTYEVCIGKKKNWRGKITDKQFKKIIWVHENVKPVYIFILEKDGSLREKITDYSIFKNKE